MKYVRSTAGFTLVELLVSISIFAFMTALLVVKYGNFNNGVLITNLAYDVALTIRQAQSFGLNVKQADNSKTCIGTFGASGDAFQCSYGAHFETADSSHFKLFLDDYLVNSVYDCVGTSCSTGGDYIINSYAIKRGATVSRLCVTTGTGSCNDVSSLDIVFQRPNPDAIINGSTVNTYAQIELRATDGTLKHVVVRKTGQISIEN